MAVPSTSRKEPHAGDAAKQQPKQRNSNPGVRVVGGRIYCPLNGKTCHQCRQKTLDFTAACKNVKANKPCTIKFCHKCLLNRYGEKAQDTAVMEDWICPKCRGICNCSFCMKKKGHKPTGILVHTAKKTGYSSVSEMLSFRGPDSLDGDKCANHADSPSKKSSNFDKNPAVLSPKKHGKENTSGQNMDPNLKIKSLVAKADKKSPKKRKCDELKGTSNNRNGEEFLFKDRIPKRHSIPENVSGKGTQQERKDKSGLRERKTQKARSSDLVNEEKPKIRKCAGGLKGTVADDVTVKNKISVDPAQVKELHVEIPLPEGVPLASLAGVELPPEAVGDALQFLEFCAAFGKVLDLRKGEAESIIRELTCGRRRRHGQASKLVRFHIQLISLILEDMGEECSTMTSASGRNSWFQALGKCLSEYRCLFEDFPLDFLDRGVEEYDNLDLTKKLRVLNILCDEALNTERLRSWIEEENKRYIENAREAREKLHEAKDKKKLLKQKLQNEVAEAIIAKNGIPLSFSEHEAIVLQVKHEIALAHAEMLEMGRISKKRHRSDAVRTEPLIVDTNGCSFWKLKVYRGEPDILLQDTTHDSVGLEEKWLSFHAEKKQEIDRYISSIVRRSRVQKIYPCTTLI